LELAKAVIDPDDVGITAAGTIVGNPRVEIAIAIDIAKRNIRTVAISQRELLGDAGKVSGTVVFPDEVGLSP
jgi:hypothetical protein